MDLDDDSLLDLSRDGDRSLEFLLEVGISRSTLEGCFGWLEGRALTKVGIGLRLLAFSDFLLTSFGLFDFSSTDLSSDILWSANTAADFEEIGFDA